MRRGVEPGAMAPPTAPCGGGVGIAGLESCGPPFRAVRKPLTSWNCMAGTEMGKRFRGGDAARKDRDGRRERRYG